MIVNNHDNDNIMFSNEYRKLKFVTYIKTRINNECY